jgi:hypothetical protein
MYTTLSRIGLLLMNLMHYKRTIVCVLSIHTFSLILKGTIADTCVLVDSKTIVYRQFPVK